ncbi:MAG: branched-chain-amino acid aminotransferase [Nitrospinae bacterium]|nr:branched-chain-amino acid aminotransferase [Nitrospinota bacterium]MZH14231.1 branched-chain-amino acid aminotransferase [Nitrospinota bacterium]
MATKININGDIQDEAFISILDHGFLFGDSIYEVVSTNHGKPCFLDEHLERLFASASGISLNIPSSKNEIKDQIQTTLDSAGNSESYIRIIITRGVGEIDLDPSSCLKPNIIILVKDFPQIPEEKYAKGISVALVSIKRNSRDSLNPAVKTGNYLNNILARVEAAKTGAEDAIMMNPWGQLTEATTSNLFFVIDGRLLTPDKECGILSGITRDKIIQLANENGMPLEEGKWPGEELLKAEEIFLSGTVKNIMPVSVLDNRPVGNGKPGPITRKMMKLYSELLENLNPA